MAREMARAQKRCEIFDDGNFGRSRTCYTVGNSKPGGLMLSSVVRISTMATSGCKSLKLANIRLVPVKYGN